MCRFRVATSGFTRYRLSFRVVPYSKAIFRSLKKYIDTITTLIHLLDGHLCPLSDESLYYFFLIVKERQPILAYRSDWLNRQCEMLC